MLSIRTILHPTDFSECSKHAFRLAYSLARDHRARLIVAHVLPESATPLSGVMTPPPSEDYLKAREELENMRARDGKVIMEHHMLSGDPAAEICELAESTRTKLIVLGTHGRTGLRRLLMGSVAEQVARRAPCPVLTVRVPLRIVRRRRARATARETARS